MLDWIGDLEIVYIDIEREEKKGEVREKRSVPALRTHESPALSDKSSLDWW